MRLHELWQGWIDGLRAPRNRRCRPRSHPRRRRTPLALELLEDRTLPSTFTVTSTADDGSTGTLRWALTQVNADTDPTSTVLFNIAPSGVQTITVTSPTGTINHPVTIDGTSEPGYAGTPLIVLDGTQVTNTSNGLSIAGGNSTVKGLAIVGFSDGVHLTGNGGDVIEGNFIGVNAAGTPQGNSNNGITISGCGGNTIGGTDPSDRNIISANAFNGISIRNSGASNNSIEGNYIGTNIAGTLALGNTKVGVMLDDGAQNNVIGGLDTNAPGQPLAGGGNLISGNQGSGVVLQVSDAGTPATSGNIVEGNYVGTDYTGMYNLPNSVDGINLHGLVGSVTNNIIGGTSAAARNVISGNLASGVIIHQVAATGNFVEGNYIGTNALGTGKLANGGSGVDIDGGPQYNTIGGTAAGAGNVISGNLGDGVDLFSVSNLVEGNLIGTDVTGTHSLGNAFSGVDVNAGSSGNTIGGTTAGAGNVISGNGSNGIEIDTGDTILIQGNFIGTDITGTVALGNAGSGVQTDFLATGVTIGGTTASARNIISGNLAGGLGLFSGSSLVEGNLIGTDVTGTHALGNAGIGVHVANILSGDTIGGTAAGAGNVISGNRSHGLEFDTGDTILIQGNFIGTDITGTVALGNAGNGVQTDGSATGVTIGGTSASARNIISGNLADGIAVFSGVNNLVEGNFIGTDVTGTVALANHNHGVRMAGATGGTIGGTAAGAGNVISANLFNGIDIGASDPVLIQGNFIGTDITGTLRLGNSSSGVQADGSATGVTIGGTTASARNIISGNLANGVFVFSGSCLVEGNLLGTDVTGTHALGNAVNGVQLQTSSSGNTIGGTAAGAGNVISGNGANGIQMDTGNTSLIQGNFIGTDITGTVALGNSGNGVQTDGSATGVTIGGTSASARNIISGNLDSGVGLFSGSSLVEGNLIGTDVTGTHALGNRFHGVHVSASSSGNTIGDTAAGAGNVISGNGSNGIQIDTGNTSLIQGNFIGTDITGTVALGNSGNGVQTDGSATGVTIGGTSANARNIISGNLINGVGLYSGSSLVEGNFIGTDVTGTHALGNAFCGVYAGSSGNTIGGTTAQAGMAAGNLVSGNGVDGIAITGAGATDNLVLGNLVGLNASGTGKLPNSGFDGLGIDSGAAANTIGGTASGARNVISGNADVGLELFAAGANNVVVGNYIGLDITGTVGLGNATNGISVDSSSNNNSLIGNVISGNTLRGIFIVSVSQIVVQGNRIGTNAAGTAGIGNGTIGISISSAAANTIGGTSAGTGNTIADNGGTGVSVVGSTSTGNAILRNSIYGNGGLGIDLGHTGVTRPNTPGGPHTGPNDFQNFPGIATEQVQTGSSTQVAGTLNSTPNTTFAIDFYANPAAAGPVWQAQRYLGSTSVTTDSNGNSSFSVLLSAATSSGEVITATATDPNGNTSEIGGQLPLVTPVAGQTPVEGTSSPIDLGTLADLDGSPWSVDVNWGDGSADTVFTAASAGALGTQNHTYAEEGPYTVTVTATDQTGLARATTFNVAVSDPAVVGVGVPVLGFAAKVLNGTPLALFADPAGPEALSDYSAVINWGDGSNPDHNSGISLAGTVFTVTGSHTFAAAGSYTITITVAHEGVSTQLTTAATLGYNTGLLLLDSTGSGALTDTGGGTVAVTGPGGTIIVDSNNSQAASLTGNGTVSAAFVNITGGVKSAGNALLLGQLAHPAPTPDPLGLPLPPAPTPTYAAVNYSGSAPLTLSPGTYVGGIKITGQANVTLLPGIYYMQGGGFSATGKVSVSGAGVLLVNAPAKASDTISFTGQGTVTLSAPPSLSGVYANYAGLVILQDPASSAPINVTGQGKIDLTGMVYAPQATLNITGQGGVIVNAEVILDDLKVTGQGGLTVNLALAGAAPGDSLFSALGALAQGGTPLSARMAQQFLGDNSALSTSGVTAQMRDAYFAALGNPPSGGAANVAAALANPTPQNQEWLFWFLAEDLLELGHGL